MLNKIIPAILAAIGIVLCQIHGGPFWVFLMAGNIWIGWTTSILWEGMSVWLWWDKRHWLKWIPTAFLLAGMVFQSVSPILNAVERVENAQNIQTNAQKALDKMLVVIADQKRRGFKDTLHKLLDVTLKPKRVETAPTGVLRWLPAIPTIGFLAMYLLSLFFISGLKTVPKQPETKLNEDEQLALELKQKIDMRLEQPGVTYKKLAEEVGIPGSVLNNIVHRERKRKAGKPVIGIARLRKCAEKLK